MLLKLLAKDIKAYGFFIFIGYATQIAFSSFMVTYGNDDSWKPYIFIGCVQISIIVLFNLIFEKINKYEKLSFSLPIKRKQYILSKFVESVIIIIIGLALWYFTALLLHSSTGMVPTDFRRFESAEVIIIIALYFSLFTSLFVPLSITLKKTWISGIILILIAYIFVKSIDKSYFQYGSEADSISIFVVSIYSLLVMLPLLISYLFTTILFKKEDVT